MDSIPVVGTGFRVLNAIVAHVEGDHERAQREWGEAGANFAGDLLGLATGGAGKVAFAAAKAGGKAIVKGAAKEGMAVLAKETLAHTAKEGSKAALRAAQKQVSKKAMKRYAKKYVKKKTKKAIKEGLEQALEEEEQQEEEEDEGLEQALEAEEEEEDEGLEQEEEEDDDDEVCILQEMHRFSGHWKGFYKQWGSSHDMQCMLVIGMDGCMAGRGSDEVSDYTVSGRIEDDGTFKFRKQYTGPTHNHLVLYADSGQ